MKTMTFLLICTLFFTALLNAAHHKQPEIPGKLRNEYLERAQVWKRVPVPKVLIVQGPKSAVAVRPESTVTCRYAEPKEPPEGTTLKFKCTLPSGELLRVKYGNSGEVYAEVAASRLLWALGFYADADYPVKIKCLGCPEKNPFKPEKDEPRVTKLITDAIIEPNFPGAIIEESEDQGWSWSELSKVSEKSGGATPAQLDAFRLLAVFIQHADNKATNQRLACYGEDIVDQNGEGSCKKPVLMIADLGATFGSSEGFITEGSKMNFANWKKTGIWNLTMEHDYLTQHERQICIGNLANTKKAEGEGLQNPQISEEGRKFLADLLNQLTLKQIKDLFRVSDVERLNESIEDDGVRRKVTVEDWTAAFIAKRNEINERHCPSLAPAE